MRALMVVQLQHQRQRPLLHLILIKLVQLFQIQLVRRRHEIRQCSQFIVVDWIRICVDNGSCLPIVHICSLVNVVNVAAMLSTAVDTLLQDFLRPHLLTDAMHCVLRPRCDQES